MPPSRFDIVPVRNEKQNLPQYLHLIASALLCASCLEPSDAGLADSATPDIHRLTQGIVDTPVTRHGVSSAMREAAGWLTPTQLAQTCAQKRALYGVGTIEPGTGARPPSGAPRSVSCAQFRTEFADGPFHIVAESVRLTEACEFSDIRVLIAQSNVLFDCNGSTFTAQNANDIGVQLDETRLPDPMNPIHAAREKLSDGTLAPLHDVEVRGCNFNGFATGIDFNNYYDRENLNDQIFYNSKLNQLATPAHLYEIGEQTGADEIREKSPHHISIRNVRIRNARDWAIYLHDHLHDIAIDNVTIIPRLDSGGLYLDHGSRNVAVTNSCFEDANNVSRREFIAVDASALHRIDSNLFYGNPAAAIRLYKNCSENFAAPHQFSRAGPSDQNRILRNAIVGLVNSHSGVVIASRQWSDGLKADGTSQGCGDTPVYAATGASAIRDYARDNEVAGNVMFAPSIAVKVMDDGNHVHDNFVYIAAGKSSPTFSVGHHQDLVFRQRSIRRVELKRNWIEIRNQSTRPTSVFSGTVEFLAEGRGGTLFSGNIFEEAPMCALPLNFPSTNVPGDSCRMGTFSDSRVVIEPYRTGSLTDGGTIHGQGVFDCTPAGWRAVSGYCCTGAGCARTSIAGRTEFAPYGKLESVSMSGIKGWATDPNVDGGIWVHIYIDGVLQGAALAVETIFGGVGPHSFQFIPPPLGPGAHSVAVYAIGSDSQGIPDGENYPLDGSLVASYYDYDFIKPGNNGTVSCNTFCQGAQWGEVGGCVGAERTDNGQRVSCSTVPGLLANSNQLTCECVRGYIKPGNNGTVSCGTFCAGAQWGAVGRCVGAVRSDTGQRLTCSSVPGLFGGELTCQCVPPL